MNDPRSSNVRGGAAKQATTDVSDLGYRARRVERPRRGLTWTAEYIFYPRRTRKARREYFKENGHVQASAPEWSYGAEVMGLPLRATSQAAPSLLHHPFQGSKPVHDENRFA